MANTWQSSVKPFYEITCLTCAEPMGEEDTNGFSLLPCEDEESIHPSESGTIDHWFCGCCAELLDPENKRNQQDGGTHVTAWVALSKNPFTKEQIDHVSELPEVRKRLAINRLKGTW